MSEHKEDPSGSISGNHKELWLGEIALRALGSRSTTTVQGALHGITTGGFESTENFKIFTWSSKDSYPLYIQLESKRGGSGWQYTRDCGKMKKKKKSSACEGRKSAFVRNPTAANSEMSKTKDEEESEDEKVHGEVTPNQKRSKKRPRDQQRSLAENESKRHKRAVPSPTPEKPVSGHPYGCGACPERYDTMVQLRDHLKELHPALTLEKPFRCAGCHRIYKVRSNNLDSLKKCCDPD